MDGSGDPMAIIGGVGFLMAIASAVMALSTKDKGYWGFVLAGLAMTVAGAAFDNHVPGGYGF